MSYRLMIFLTFAILLLFLAILFMPCCAIPCLTRSALVLRLFSANPLKTLICRHICGVTDHVNRPMVLVFLCDMC